MSTHGSVVPVHPEVVVGEDCGRPVDVVQGELHRGHHTLACSSNAWSVTTLALVCVVAVSFLLET